MENSKPRCPYLAINIPGERPFVMERKLYEAATRGIHITGTTLTKQPVKDHGEIWVLTITHNGGRVRGTLKFYSLLQTKFKDTYWMFKRDLADWAARAYKKKQASVAGPLTAHQKQIKRLEKELSNLYAHRPVNPLLQVGMECVGDRNYRERWRKGRSERMQLALVGGWVLSGAIPPVKAYELLAEAGYMVRKFSKVSGSYRKWLGVHDERDYWKSLYRFTDDGLSPHKRKRSFPETPLTEQLTEHRKSLIEFTAQRREMNSIKSQIESIQQLAAAVVPAANETGVVYA